jgi:pyroglutamyl-peptidase
VKLLITGFEPFGEDTVNPSYEVIRGISDKFKNDHIEIMQVPVVFRQSVEVVVEKIDELNPDVVLMFGQAGGRYDITIERIAINIDDAKIPDNSGMQPIDETIDAEGGAAYFATIPIKAITEGIKAVNVPASISNSAGTYVCNHLMYGVLRHIDKSKLNIKAGFIHIPFLMEQTLNRPNTPAMDLNTMIRAAEKAIEVIITTEEDLRVNGGAIC